MTQTRKTIAPGRASPPAAPRERPSVSVPYGGQERAQRGPHAGEAEDAEHEQDPGAGRVAYEVPDDGPRRGQDGALVAPGDGAVCAARTRGPVRSRTGGSVRRRERGPVRRRARALVAFRPGRPVARAAAGRAVAQEGPGGEEEDEQQRRRYREGESDAAVDDEQADERGDDDGEADARLHEALGPAPVHGGHVVRDQGLRDALERVGRGGEGDDAQHQRGQAARPGDQRERDGGERGAREDDPPAAPPLPRAPVGQEARPRLDQDAEHVVQAHDQADEARRGEVLPQLGGHLGVVEVPDGLLREDGERDPQDRVRAHPRGPERGAGQVFRGCAVRHGGSFAICHSKPVCYLL